MLQDYLLFIRKLKENLEDIKILLVYLIKKIMMELFLIEIKITKKFEFIIFI